MVAPTFLTPYLLAEKSSYTLIGWASAYPQWVEATNHSAVCNLTFPSPNGIAAHLCRFWLGHLTPSAFYYERTRWLSEFLVMSDSSATRQLNQSPASPREQGCTGKYYVMFRSGCVKFTDSRNINLKLLASPDDSCHVWNRSSSVNPCLARNRRFFSPFGLTKLSVMELSDKTRQKR